MLIQTIVVQHNKTRIIAAQYIMVNNYYKTDGEALLCLCRICITYLVTITANLVNI